MDRKIYLASLIGLGLAVGLTSKDFASSKARTPIRHSVPDRLEIRVALDSNGNKATIIEDNGKAYLVGYDKQGKPKIVPAYNVSTVED